MKSTPSQFSHNRIIEKQNIDRVSIDTLIVVSTSHDFRYPASACVLQGRLNLSDDCTCFDLSGLGCSGYVHGLFTAHSLIASGASKRLLLLVGDTLSNHTNTEDRNTSILFGDAGSATLLEYSNEDLTNYFYTGTQGKGYDNLISPAGGYYLPIYEDIANLKIKDDKGNIVPVNPTRIIMGSNYKLKDALIRGLKSRYGSAMAGNGINTQYGKWEIVESPYLSDISGFGDTDLGIIILDPERNREGKGAVWKDRKPLTIKSYVNDDNDANIWKGRARFGVNFADWRAMAYINFKGTSTNGTEIPTKTALVYKTKAQS